MEMTIQNMVQEFRDKYEDVWPTPPPMDCWNYIVQEVAEVGDCLLRLGWGNRDDYLRMHDRLEDRVDLITELGDVVLMVATLCSLMEVDMDIALDMALEEKERKIMEEYE